MPPAKSNLPLDAGAVAALRAAVVAWFRREGRDYPWRRTLDPYAILVSEVMLQQTQIATVLGRGYYERWMERFPDVRALAEASEPEILKAWEGLGYYSRARNLQRAARAVVEQHGGCFPAGPESVAALPGVGRYTAGAVLSFASDFPAAIVDGNIARVLARLFAMEEEIDGSAGRRILWERAEALTDPRHPRLYNSGIMELGQRICTVRQPACGECPVRTFCLSAGPEASRLPRKKPARRTVEVDEHVIWALHRGRLLLCQESGTRRRGLWRLPERPLTDVTGHPILSRTRYAITHHRVTLTVHECPNAVPGPGESWHALHDLTGLAMPGPLRRVIDALAADAG